ncbi:hypothetical protein L6452_01474 [Arctium lappa]|uniref:Uncharacterized protein n=1 Tax=Arctium lappa TaxID=4217 RepID=A0ACB9FH83_ARCLA|nr:hypothetical protein L6452_01474 [Arctium lappa]
MNVSFLARFMFFWCRHLEFYGNFDKPCLALRPSAKDQAKMITKVEVDSPISSMRGRAGALSSRPSSIEPGSCETKTVGLGLSCAEEVGWGWGWGWV